MSTSDRIAVVSLIFTLVTTICVLYLAYAALAHTARPHLTARLRSPARLQCGTESLIVFEVVNIGHWFGSPMAVDVAVYCNFPPVFQLRELRYGSVQEHTNTEVKRGKRGANYLKAKGLMLSRHKDGEEIHVVAMSPSDPGTYTIGLTAYSSNDASFTKEFTVSCVSAGP